MSLGLKAQRCASAAEGRAFMRARGNSLPGYIEFYGRFGRDPEYAAKVYEADRRFQEALEARAAGDAHAMTKYFAETRGA